MVMRGASVDDSEVLTPLYEEDGPPLTLSDLASLDAAEVLDFAEVLPPDGALVDVLLSLRRDRLDQTSQARLARLWARVEAVACGHKLAAVGAIDLAGPEPGDLVDMRDQEIAVALNVGLKRARSERAVAGVCLEKGQAVLAAVQDGRLGYGHVLQYFDALVGLTPEQAARVQELTLDKAMTMTPSELRRLLRRTVARVGAEDFARQHTQAVKDTHVSVSYDQPDGMAELSGRMSAVDAAIIEKAVEAWARAAKSGGDPRPLCALRAAALVDIAERYLLTPDAPRANGRPISVLLAMDLPTFLGLTDHPGEVIGAGAMIPADALRDLIPQAALRRIITDPMTGHLLDYGRTTYRFPPGLKAFLIAKWVTSTGPGSTVPAERGDFDHGKAWDDGGETNRENGNPVNRRWHRAKTLGGWTVEQRDDKWVWTSPLGLQHESSPHDYRLGP